MQCIFFLKKGISEIHQQRVVSGEQFTITSLSSFVVLITCNTKLNSKGCALARCKNSFFYLNTKMCNSLAYSIKKKFTSKGPETKSIKYTTITFFTKGPNIYIFFKKKIKIPACPSITSICIVDERTTIHRRTRHHRLRTNKKNKRQRLDSIESCSFPYTNATRMDGKV